MVKAERLARKMADSIREGLWPPAPQLPTVRQLAVEWQTSPVTILQVLIKLEHEGLVQRIPGRKGYFITDSDSIQPTPKDYPRHRQRYLAISEELHAEILSGVYSRDDLLPSLKQMQTRFACTHATIRAALGHLEMSGAVQRKGRGFALREAAHPNREQALVHLAGHSYLLRIFHGHVLSFIRSLEESIHKMNWGQLKVFLSDQPDPASAPPDHQIAGFIHFSSYRTEQWMRLFRVKPKVPLVIIDTNEEFSRPPWLAGRQFFRIHSDNRGAGRDVGRMLAAKGHKHVAYLNHFRSEAPWVRNRMAGLAEIFPIGGELTDHSLTCLHLTEEAPRKNEQLKAIQLAQASFKAGDFLPRQLRQERFDPLYDMTNSYATAVKMEAIFQRALAMERVSAWVCCNDEVAAMALAFLERLNIPVPGRVAVIGFDNSSLSYRLGLTSYDFGFAPMGHLALRCLSEPGRIAMDAGGNIRVAGQIITRSTTHG